MDRGSPVAVVEEEERQPDRASTIRTLVVLIGAPGSGKKTLINTLNRANSSAPQQTVSLQSCCRYANQLNDARQFFASVSEKPTVYIQKDHPDLPGRYRHIVTAWKQNNPPVAFSDGGSSKRKVRSQAVSYSEVTRMPEPERMRLMQYSKEWSIFSFRAIDFFLLSKKLAYLSQLWIWNAPHATALQKSATEKPRQGMHFPSSTSAASMVGQKLTELSPSPSPQSACVCYYLDSFIEQCMLMAPRSYVIMHQADVPLKPPELDELLKRYSGDCRGPLSSVFLVLNIRASFFADCKKNSENVYSRMLAENRSTAIEFCYKRSAKYAEVDANNQESIDKLLEFISSVELCLSYRKREKLTAKKGPSDIIKDTIEAAIAADEAVEKSQIQALLLTDSKPMAIKVTEIRSDEDINRVQSADAQKTLREAGAKNEKLSPLLVLGKKEYNPVPIESITENIQLITTAQDEGGCSVGQCTLQ